jgi:hypothetical protein
VVLAMIPVLIFGDRGSHDLFAVKKENISLNIQNSAKGLELLEQIDRFKRLTANDLKLIEHIARSELGLVREGELIFVSELATDASIPQIKIEGMQPTFRFLTEEEFEELLNFDLKSFDFYEELSEFEKPAYPSSFNLHD